MYYTLQEFSKKCFLVKFIVYFDIKINYVIQLLLKFTMCIDIWRRVIYNREHQFLSRHKKSAGFDIIASPGETLQISIFAGTTSVANPLETTRSKTRHQTRPWSVFAANTECISVRLLSKYGAKKGEKSEATDGKNWKSKMESPRSRWKREKRSKKKEMGRTETCTIIFAISIHRLSRYVWRIQINIRFN